MESRRNGPQLSSRHDDDDDDQRLMPSYGGLLEPSRSKLKNLRLMLKIWVGRLFWSVSSDFGAVHS